MAGLKSATRAHRTDGARGFARAGGGVFRMAQRFRIPFELMRVYSPSAEVQGHGPGRRCCKPASATSRWSTWSPVGNYAVKPTFSRWARQRHLQLGLPLRAGPAAGCAVASTTPSAWQRLGWTAMRPWRAKGGPRWPRLCQPLRRRRVLNCCTMRLLLEHVPACACRSSRWTHFMIKSRARMPRMRCGVVAVRRAQRLASFLMSTTHFGFQSVDEQEKAQRVRGVFDSVASKYDVMNDLMSAGLHRAWKAYTVMVANLREGQPGAGHCRRHGRLVAGLCQKGGRHRPRGAHRHQRSHAARGRDRLLDAGVVLPTLVCDAEQLPFPDAHFDVRQRGLWPAQHDAQGHAR